MINGTFNTHNIIFIFTQVQYCTDCVFLEFQEELEEPWYKLRRIFLLAGSPLHWPKDRHVGTFMLQKRQISNISFLENQNWWITWTKHKRSAEIQLIELCVWHLRGHLPKSGMAIVGLNFLISSFLCHERYPCTSHKMGISLWKLFKKRKHTVILSFGCSTTWEGLVQGWFGANFKESLLIK